MTNTENLLYEQRILALEKKLLEITAELAASKMENEDFINIAAHDLQAPLRKALTFTDRLVTKTADSIPAKAKVYIEKVQSNLADMQDMIDSLSSFSHILTEDINWSACDLSMIASTVLNEEKNEAQKISVKTDQLPVVDGDPQQLKEVFKNIINNAVKFKRKETDPELRIRSSIVPLEETVLMELDPEKIYYKIEFIDNGIGFTADNADKIFKPFRRLHGKASYPGNGLGLAICKKVIEKHHGLIYAKANENIGATIVLILPQIHSPA